MNMYLALPSVLFWLSNILAGGVFLFALLTAPWRKLFAADERQHLWYGTMVFLGVGWSLMGIEVKEVFRIHPVLITSATLIFGFRLSVLAAAGALIISTVFTKGIWQTVPYTWCVMALLPATVTYGLLVFITRMRIQNLFLYTLGVGFVGGMLTALCMGIFVPLTLMPFAPPYFETVWENSYLFFLLIFPEGFVNGTIVSTLAVMAPHLVKTYDDDFYLK